MLPFLLLIFLYVSTDGADYGYPTHLYYPIGEGKRSFKSEKVFTDRIKRGYAPPIPAYARGQCATTTENEKFPWWRVKLDKEAYVTEVKVFSNLPNSTYKMHDVEIRVGNEDIQDNSQKEATFGKNNICKTVDGVINKKQFEAMCKQNLVGKYVSLQINKPCLSNYGCTKNVLNLCEVQVKGYYMDDIKDKPVTLAKPVHMSAKQSSVILGGNPSLAVDGVVKTEFYKVTKNNLCATIYENQEKNYVTYEIMLNEMFEIKDVTFQSTSKITTDPFIIEAFVEYEGLKDLEEKSKEPSQKCGKLTKKIQGKHSILCNPKYLGKVLLLRVKRDCGFRNCPGRVNNGNITNCKFDIRGYPVYNVAEGKDTKQSSTYDGGHSTLAIDKHLSGIHMENGHPTCAHTKVDEIYPWWRIDLEADHLVDSLLIYNRKEGLHHRLHDIDIRIGTEDISSFYYGESNKISGTFYRNRICKSFANKILPPGANNVTCDHPLIGRYVSIQITSYCRTNGCKERTSNILTLCEVEVYGFRIDRYTYGDAAQGKVIASGAKTRVTSNKALERLGVLAFMLGHVNGREIKWWQIDLGTEAQEVQSVEILTGEKDKKYFTPVPIEIIVGFANFQYLESSGNLPFHSAAICLSTNVTLAPVINLQCLGSVVGRYVTILSPGLCSNPPCKKLTNLLKIRSIQVWGSKIRRYDLEEKFPIKWEAGHGMVADDRKLQVLYNFIRTPQCTHTSTSDEYPWWQAEFTKNVVVYSVNIWNRNDLSHRLHDIEIRVGPNDIPRNAGDKPFTFNQVCASKTVSLPKWKTTITCVSPVVGRYLTIQIVKKCLSPDCKFQPYNILSLCEVEIQGYSLDIFRGTKTNVALGKSTSQSSTGYGRGSNLATDGKTS